MSERSFQVSQDADLVIGRSEEGGATEQSIIYEPTLENVLAGDASGPFLMTFLNTAHLTSQTGYHRLTLDL